MPSVSKVKPLSTRTKKAAPLEEERTTFYCSRCGRKHTRQKRNYPASQSPLYRGNGGYLTVCNNCVDEVFNHFKDIFGSEKEAIKRTCMKFDIYWSEDVYAMLTKGNTSHSRIRLYISKTNLIHYIGKTYDDTLDEEYSLRLIRRQQANAESDAESQELLLEEITQEVMDFWGAGFEPAFYLELNRKYESWTADVPKPMDKGREAIYKQICILEATINRDLASGKPIEKNVNALNNLLGSANLKPSQQPDDVNEEFAGMPFGVGIRMYENVRPIPKPDPEFEDVDGIVRYISIWFLGHLCKMLNIKNSYCELYERELMKLRVENPELEDEDDESLFNDIFGDDE